MQKPVGLYDSAYGHYEAEVYREVRMATYGEDLGQTSWATNEESREIPRALGISAVSSVLEVGCGSGRYAVQVVETTGCRIVGVDLNEAAVNNGNHLARDRGCAERATFSQCDVSKPLPYSDVEFDAVFANDVLCHIPGRERLLRELSRILKPSGRLLFSDALVIGGAVSHQEIATRSSIGYYLFTPPGYNEGLIADAGMELLEAKDTTASAAEIARRWRDAREQRRSALLAAEGDATFDGVQRFLACVHTLCSERRLLRFVYLAQQRTA